MRFYTFALAMERIGRFAGVVLCVLFTAQAQILWQEDFDGNVSNWVFGPTPSGISGLNYGTNGSCNNYWVINAAHTPDPNNNFLGHRGICNNVPNPTGGFNNRSLHITYQSCAGVVGTEPAPPDSGDAYSWNGISSNSEQFAYYNADISTIGACGLYLEFWTYLGGDDAIPGNTDRSVLYSTDGGATWKVLVNDIATDLTPPIYDPSTAGQCKNWTKVSIPLPPDAENIPNLRIGFRWRNDNSVGGIHTLSSGFNIDNIRLVSRAFDADFTADRTTICHDEVVYLSSYFVTQPPIDLNNPPSYTYTWTITPATGWTVVGGSLNSDNVQIQFTAAGTYTVALVVTQNGGACSGQSETITKTNYITVLPSCPPTAAFTANYTTVCATNPTPPTGSIIEVAFTDLSQSPYPITNWQWNITGPGTVNFVSGTNANSQNPVVTFSAPGTYTVQLTVTNSDGSDDTVITNYINVIDCQCNTVGGGGNVQVTTLDSVTFNSGSWPASWGTAGGNSDAYWIVNNNYNTSTGGTVAAQPPQIAGAPNSNYAHITCNNVFCSLLGYTGTAVYFDNGSFTTQTVYLLSNVYNVSTYDSIRIQYWYLVAGDPGNDYGFLEYSINGGATWTPLGAPLVNQLTWTQRSHTLDLAALGNPTTIQFRWGFQISHDGGGGDPPLCLDDILIHAFSPGSGGGTNGVFTCPVNTELCAGDTITITFNGSGTFNPGNLFIAQLSDATGNFASAINLDTLAWSGTDPNNLTMDIVIPRNIICGGNGYRIRVISTDPAYNAPPNVTNNGSDITIRCQPTNLVLDGDTLVCASNIATLYQASANNAVNFQWNLSGSSGTITANYGDSVKIVWSQAGTAMLTVTAQNQCGSVSDSLIILVQDSLYLQDLTGPSPVCQSTSVTYTAIGDNGINYIWNIIGNGTFLSDSTLNSVQVQWNTPGVYIIKVKGLSGCNEDSLEKTIVVQAPPVSPPVQGPNSTCTGDTVALAINLPGVQTTWSSQIGTFIGDSTLNAVTIYYPNRGQDTITVVVQNNCGSDTVQHVIDIVDQLVFVEITPDTFCLEGIDSADVIHSAQIIGSGTYQWNVVSGGRIIGANNQNSVRVRWAINATSYQLRLVVNSKCGTIDTTVTLEVYPQPRAIIAVQPDTICQYDSLQFLDLSTPAGTRWTWYFGNGDSSTLQNPTYAYGDSGTYTVTFITSVEGTCPDTAQTTVVILPAPQIQLVAQPNPSYLPETPQLDANPQFTDILIWYFSATDSLVQVPPFSPVNAPYDQPGIYTIRVIARNQSGCEAEDSIQIEIKDLTKVILPNVFTPNGDGTNDFYAPTVSGVSEYTLTIYDRWGQAIAVLKENQRWDGTVNGRPAPAGVYVAHFKGKTITGETIERVIYFTLIR